MKPFVSNAGLRFVQELSFESIGSYYHAWGGCYHPNLERQLQTRDVKSPKEGDSVGNSEKNKSLKALEEHKSLETHAQDNRMLYFHEAFARAAQKHTDLGELGKGHDVRTFCKGLQKDTLRSFR